MESKEKVRRVYADSEVNLELMDAVSKSGIREINVVPDEEFISTSFADWLMSNKDEIRKNATKEEE